MARQEARINRTAWFGGIAVSVVTLGTLALLLVARPDHSWEFAVYIALAGVPLAYALFCNVVIRRMQISLFQRYHAQLLGRVTDLQDLVYKDELTGLFNRRHFYEALQAEVSRAHRSKEPLALMLLDLDGLKAINDEHGHRVGDAVIASVAGVMMKHVRTHDVPCRLGGDEYGVIMPSTDKRGAFALARRLWDELEQTPMYTEGEKRVMVNVSIGLAGFPWGGESVEEMIQWADADMYANKVSRRLPKAAVATDNTPGMDAIAGDAWDEMQRKR